METPEAGPLPRVQVREPAGYGADHGKERGGAVRRLARGGGVHRAGAARAAGGPDEQGRPRGRGGVRVAAVPYSRHHRSGGLWYGVVRGHGGAAQGGGGAHGGGEADRADRRGRGRGHRRGHHGGGGGDPVRGADGGAFESDPPSQPVGPACGRGQACGPEAQGVRNDNAELDAEQGGEDEARSGRGVQRARGGNGHYGPAPTFPHLRGKPDRAGGAPKPKYLLHCRPGDGERCLGEHLVPACAQPGRASAGARGSAPGVRRGRRLHPRQRPGAGDGVLPRMPQGITAARAGGPASGTRSPGGRGVGRGEHPQRHRPGGALRCSPPPPHVVPRAGALPPGEIPPRRRLETTAVGVVVPLQPGAAPVHRQSTSSSSAPIGT
mmetsp:Transcript_13890/g.39519  ORF Transcript_13890/g.39519 Transcript_13890/m.39519 type:complete len:380 (+) Transcript_13890:617-1756(+)